MDHQFLLQALTIVVIDLILSGDNGVVIAMAVRSLPKRTRARAILAGTGFAVGLRVVLTFFAAHLLRLQFIQLVGGVLILWIAIQLFTGDNDAGGPNEEIRGFWRAIRYIVVADVTMSTDNILAVAATAQDHMGLLLFGLGLSIPFVVFSSGLLAMLMERYPAVVWVGAAVLGKVGSQMMLTDPFTLKMFHPGKWWQYGIEAAAAVGVVLVGKLLAKDVSSQAS